MRQVVLDTETTGLSTAEGHRIIEIGCLELQNRRLTGREFHCFINPEREIDEGAEQVHGINLSDLQGRPLFADIADEFLEFVRGSELVIHNAEFDVGFLDYELSLMKHAQPRIADHASVLDTLGLARKLHPGQRNSLDALCKRYNVVGCFTFTIRQYRLNLFVHADVQTPPSLSDSERCLCRHLEFQVSKPAIRV